MRKETEAYKEKMLRKQKRTDEITRLIAIAIAFVSVVIFFIKLLFL